jgi:hypothetical protein
LWSDSCFLFRNWPSVLQMAVSPFVFQFTRGLDRKSVIVIPVGVRITGAGSRFGAARWTTLVLGCAPNHGSSPESRFRSRFLGGQENTSPAPAPRVFNFPRHRRTRTKNPTTRPSCVTVREALIRASFGKFDAVEIVEKLQNINDSIQTSKCIECIR